MHGRREDQGTPQRIGLRSLAIANLLTSGKVGKSSLELEFVQKGK